MIRHIKNICLVIVCVLWAAAHAAVPEEVRTVVGQMQEDGAESRAGYSKSLGVFIVAKGEANISGSLAKAKTIARANLCRISLLSSGSRFLQRLKASLAR